MMLAYLVFNVQCPHNLRNVNLRARFSLNVHHDTAFLLLNLWYSTRPSVLQICVLFVLRVLLSLLAPEFQSHIFRCPGLLQLLLLNSCSSLFPSFLQFVPIQLSIACATNGISVSLTSSAHAGFTRFALNRSVQFGFMVSPLSDVPSSVQRRQLLQTGVCARFDCLGNFRFNYYGFHLVSIFIDFHK